MGQDIMGVLYLTHPVNLHNILFPSAFGSVFHYFGIITCKNVVLSAFYHFS